MKITYCEHEDILCIRLSREPVTREVSQGWEAHVSYAGDGTIVELVLLDARKRGLLPVEILSSRSGVSEDHGLAQ